MQKRSFIKSLAAVTALMTSIPSGNGPEAARPPGRFCLRSRRLSTFS